MSSVQSNYDLSDSIVQAVLTELKGRGGFDHWWDEIDAETKAEIRQSLTDVVWEKIES